MKIEKRFYLNIFYVVIGAALLACGIFEIVDSFWSGMGGALIGVGAIRIFQFTKISKNPEYREKIETETNDERNKFIRLKAWSWAGYMYMMIAAVGSIVFKLIGREDLMFFCSGSVCLVLVLYCISYVIVKNKY